MPIPGLRVPPVDLHHIQHWVNGGRTDLDNLISLCPYHHKVVHDRGYLIAAPPGGGTFGFYRPDGTPLPSCPPLPEPDGSIGETHDADITPETIIPPWYGERLDLEPVCQRSAVRVQQLMDVSCLPTAGGGTTCYGAGVTFASDSGTAESLVLVSQDDGATWAQVESLTDNGWFNSISCASTHNCWAAGGR